MIAPVVRDIIYLHATTRACGGLAARIIARVAAQHRMTVRHMLEPVRDKPRVRARWQAMWELYDTDRYSLPAIAAALGLKDHTTVLHGIRQHQSLKLLEAA